LLLVKLLLIFRKKETSLKFNSLQGLPPEEVQKGAWRSATIYINNFSEKKAKHHAHETHLLATDRRRFLLLLFYVFLPIWDLGLVGRINIMASGLRKRKL
jgi:hypothetical protein